jgi:hypothetical protein
MSAAVPYNPVTPSAEFVKGLLGMDRKAAQAAVQTAGFTWRITKMDDTYYVCTRDMNRERVSVEIRDGRVTRAGVG